MIALYNHRKEQGNPLLPYDGFVPIIDSMWNIGKRPIDDMSQVLASCLPSFGPINGMCWIWIRTWMMMIFNAWRLYAMKESSEFVLGEVYDTEAVIGRYPHVQNEDQGNMTSMVDTMVLCLTIAYYECELARVRVDVIRVFSQSCKLLPAASNHVCAQNPCVLQNSMCFVSNWMCFQACCKVLASPGKMWDIAVLFY
jgi:hypothetical protein